MRSGRYDIREMHEAFAAVAHNRRLMVQRMTAGDDGAHARDDVSISVACFEHRPHRRENFLSMPIRRAEPLVARMAGDFELAALHENPRARKRSLERAGIAPPHDPAAMIEMQMRHDQMRDVAGFHPKRAQMLRQPSVAMIENLTFDCAEAIADSRIDQDRVIALHYKWTRQVEADAIALVGRMIGLPEFAVHDAEQASARLRPHPAGETRDCA